MTSSGTATVTLPTDEQILITREFDAPQAPRLQGVHHARAGVSDGGAGSGAAMTKVEIDLRVGGAWRYVMEANGGFEVAFHGEFREIVPNERIVSTEIYEMPGAEPLPAADEPVNTVTFTEVDGRTTLALLTQTTSKELRDMIIDSGMESGMQESMDLLEEVAASLG